jgi:subtilisin family serine protease
VIPVTSTDEGGYPSVSTNLGGSIGRNGVSAPGVGITSLTPEGGYGPFGGTSAAAALVSGAIALAWSAAPATPAEQVRAAITSSPSRRGVIPPLLDALRLYQYVTRQRGGIDDRAKQRPA